MDAIDEPTQLDLDTYKYVSGSFEITPEVIDLNHIPPEVKRQFDCETKLQWAKDAEAKAERRLKSLHIEDEVLRQKRQALDIQIMEAQDEVTNRMKQADYYWKQTAEGAVLHASWVVRKYKERIQKYKDEQREISLFSDVNYDRIKKTEGRLAKAEAKLKELEDGKGFKNT